MRRSFFFRGLIIVLSLLLFASCFKLRGFYGTRSFEPVPRPVVPGDVFLPEGYKIELVAKGLNFPTSITFDEQGKMYVLEAGYCYGEIFTDPKLLRLESDGTMKEIAKGGKNGPWTNVDYYKGSFFISEGGAMNGGKILQVDQQGHISTLVQDLPSYGDHHTNGVIVKDGYLYFGQGTATNSGIVGKDNKDFGWLMRKKDFHDVPCEDVTLNGVNYETENVLSEDGEKVKTGAYVPFGTATSKGQVIKGALPCTGSIMRVPVTGGPLELVAWGFRNPYGLAFSQDGQLFVSDNGYDRRGSRKVYGAGDILWKVKEKAWHGWPDFSGIDSLSGENFKARDIRPKTLLQKYPNLPPKPAALFGVHSSANGMDFSRTETFGYKGEVFIALFGDMAPNVGDVYGPVGYKIVRVDVNTGDITDFASNKGKVNGPASTLKTGGLERPVSVKFSPDGSALYIVDFGVVEMPKEGPSPKQKTGVIWKVSKI